MSKLSLTTESGTQVHLEIRPQDYPTHAPFEWGTFNGPPDNAVALGWNAVSETANEPISGLRFEQDYSPVAGIHQFETYVQFASTDHTVRWRPWMTVFQYQAGQAAGQMTLCIGPGATDFIDLEDAQGMQYVKWFKGVPGAMFFMQQGYALCWVAPGVGNATASLSVDSEGYLTYRGPQGTVTRLAPP